jgi:hypothetical protein
MKPQKRIDNPKKIDRRLIENQLKNGDRVIVQFSDTIYSDRMLSKLNKLCSKYGKSLRIRFYGHYSKVFDCNVLRKIPNVTSLGVDCINKAENLEYITNLENLDSLDLEVYELKETEIFNSDNLKSLSELSIGETKSKAVDLSFIKEFKDLESLYVDGMKKGLENVKYLLNLNKLTFRGVKLDHLNFLSDLKKLEELNLFYGSYKNLDALSKLKQLKTIAFSRVRQISDFDFLNSLENLEKIEFEGMSKMESTPDLSQLTQLKKIHIHNNLRLQNIKSVGEIPNLKLFQLSFAENSKSSERKNLISQSVDLLMKSTSIEYTNILHWTDELTTKKLTEKGIKMWSWDIKI